MIKYFCDVCGDEITQTNKLSNSFRLRLLKNVAIDVELVFIKDGTVKSGDICKYCFIKAIKGLDDRPKPKH